MTYNALKSIYLSNLVKVLMCFLVRWSNGGGQVSPVQTVAFRMILLSFSNCVQFNIIWLIVWSYFSPLGLVELGIALNPWRYNLIKARSVTVAVNSAEIGNLVLILSFMYGKNNLFIAPFVELVHCSCHFVNPFYFPSVIIVSLGILSYTISPMSSADAFLARRVSHFISLYPDMCFHPVKKHCPL